MLNGFRFTRVVVIESLEDGESKTGLAVAEFLRAELLARGESLPVDYWPCVSAKEFVQLLMRLQQEAELGEIPILHIECHGDANEGLEFANGSTLSWSDFASALCPINIACGYNLLVLISACFGGYFMTMMSTIKASPCWGVVAPTDAVVPYEIRNGFFAFYREFLRTWNWDLAVTALRKNSLSAGHWFGKTAERWFEEVVLGYARQWCTKKASYQRVAALHQELLKMGVPNRPLRQIKRELRVRNVEMVDKYFAEYFCIDLVPGSEVRFAETKGRIQGRISDLRQTGEYLL